MTKAAKLAECKTLADLLDALGIQPIGNVDFEQFSVISIINYTQRQIYDNFNFSLNDSRLIKNALDMVRLYNNLKVKAKSNTPKKRFISSMIQRHMNTSGGSKEPGFMAAFESLDDIKFMPGDDWPGDLCFAAASVRSYVFRNMLKKTQHKEAHEFSNGHGWTPLMYACAIGRESIAQMLVADGPSSIDQRNDQNQTALMIAAYFGHSEVIRILHRWAQSRSAANALGGTVDFRLTLESQDGQGRTALHHAADYGHFDAVNELILIGANINAEDFSGKTPADLAGADDKSSRVYKAIVRAGGRCSDDSKVDVLKPKNQQSTRTKATPCTPGRRVDALVDNKKEKIVEEDDTENGEDVLYGSF